MLDLSQFEKCKTYYMGGHEDAFRLIFAECRRVQENNRELVELIKESDDYLKPRKKGQVNTISTDSILHTKMKNILDKNKE